MALDNSNAGLIICRIRLWRSGPILVCCWMQSDDCVFCPHWNIVQAQNSRGTHFPRSGQNPIWSVHSTDLAPSYADSVRSDRPYCLYDTLPRQQYFCLCEHAPRSGGCHIRCVSAVLSARSAWSNTNTWTRTGMHIIAATFLLPVGVTVYTFVGGIKAT